MRPVRSLNAFNDEVYFYIAVVFLFLLVVVVFCLTILIKNLCAFERKTFMSEAFLLMWLSVHLARFSPLNLDRPFDHIGLTSPRTSTLMP